MFDRIRQLFTGPKLSDESREFITKLATSRIWILAVGLRGTPKVPRHTSPEAFEIIAAHRIDVSKLGKEDSVFPFNYAQNGKHLLPFFSSKEGAERFAADLGLSGDVTVFQPLRLRAGFVTARQNAIYEPVLDPLSPNERRLSKGERLLLRALSKAG